MSKQEKIRRVADELRALGWTFVAARERVQSWHARDEFSAQDQADTRLNPVYDLDVYEAVQNAAMRA